LCFRSRSQQLAHSRIVAEQLPEVVDGVGVEHGRRASPRGRGAREPKKRAELSEVLAGTDGGDDLLAAVRPLAHDLNFALLDDVDQVATRSLQEDDLAGLEADASLGL